MTATKRAPASPEQAAPECTIEDISRRFLYGDDIAEITARIPDGTARRRQTVQAALTKDRQGLVAAIEASAPYSSYCEVRQRLKKAARDNAAVLADLQERRTAGSTAREQLLEQCGDSGLTAAIATADSELRALDSQIEASQQVAATLRERLAAAQDELQAEVQRQLERSRAEMREALRERLAMRFVQLEQAIAPIICQIFCCQDLLEVFGRCPPAEPAQLLAEVLESFSPLPAALLAPPAPEPVWVDASGDFPELPKGHRVEHRAGLYQCFRPRQSKPCHATPLTREAMEMLLRSC